MSNVLLAMGYDAPVRVAAASPAVTLGDPKANAAAVIRCIRRAEEAGAAYLALPELCLTGATLGSLLSHPTVLEEAKEALRLICDAVKDCSLIAAVGLPYMVNGCVQSCAAMIRGSRVLAIIPAAGANNPFGFVPAMEPCCATKRPLTPVSRLSVGFGGELFAPAEEREGNIMLMASSLNATARSCHKVTDALAAYSARTGMAVAYASPGRGESTTSFVFDGLCAVAAQGEILAVSTPLEEEPFVYADVMNANLTAFEPYAPEDGGTYISSDPVRAEAELARILDLQAAALVRRAEHIGIKGFVLGVSGGLDSALALLACAAASERMGKPRSFTVGISMPGFGSSSRTKNNARLLTEALGCRYREISVVPACRRHFEDIGHDESIRNNVYENAQARERTKILLSVANAEGLLDVGTGDLSEAALGWTTFGGDHLAQYGVNASLPKTLIRRVVRKAAERFPEAAEVLFDILDTPVSPELLPTENGEIAQKTEELIGSYELHDLFIYHFLRGMGPRALYSLACRETDFPHEEVKRVLGIFLRRFFAQQFKRNCAPEAPLIGLSIAPAVFSMPSDLRGAAFMREYESIT